MRRKKRKHKCPACKKVIHAQHQIGDIFEHSCKAVLQMIENEETGWPVIRRFKPIKTKGVT